MGIVSEKAKRREWSDFVNFIKEEPQTMLSLVS
jgi:hypothetical protein